MLHTLSKTLTFLPFDIAPNDIQLTDPRTPQTNQFETKTI